MSDPNYSDVSLLLHFDGADESTTFTDDGPIGHTVSPQSGANIDTAQSVFGGASGDFQSGTEHLQVADHDSFSFDGDFTIECRVRHTITSIGNRVLVQKGTNNGTFEWALRQNSGTGVHFGMSTDGVNIDLGEVSTTTGFSDDTWVAVAVTREGTTYRLYVDGTLEDEVTESGSVSNSSRFLEIGGTGSTAFFGHLDELRITKGVARYTGASYALAGEAFSDEGPVTSLAATTPMPDLLMGGGASLSATVPGPSLAMVSDGMNIVIPAPILAMSPPTILTLEAVAPAPVLAMEGAVGINIEVPAPVFALVGDSSFHAFSVVVPAPDVQMAGLTGAISTFDLDTPAPILALGSAPTLEITIPVTAAFSGFNGAVSSVNVTVPPPRFSASGLSEGLSALNIAAAFRFSATAMSENLGTMRPIVVRPRFVATAVSGADASLAIVVSATASFSGYGPYEGTLAIVSPRFHVQMGITSEIAAATRTWVLNLRRKALTEYTNYDFNSYGRFREALLSAGDDGLFVHGGQDDDAGTEIAARARTGKESFGTSMNKRIPRIYANFRSTGHMRFATITSQGGERVYALPYNGLDEIQERRVPVGRGPKSPYWQFEMMNVDGSDFLIEKLQPYPEKTYRRVV